MESHDSVWDAHPGRDRRFALLSWSFEWLKMEANIELYVKTCFVCQRDKVERRVEAGPLPSGVCGGMGVQPLNFKGLFTSLVPTGSSKQGI